MIQNESVWNSAVSYCEQVTLAIFGVRGIPCGIFKKKLEEVLKLLGRINNIRVYQKGYLS